MSIRLLGMGALLALAWAASPAAAELPLLSPEQLQKQAEVIVTGTVQAVYASDQGFPNHKDYVDTVYLVALAVEQVEKGEGIKAGDPLFVRSWEAKRRPRDWVGPSGHGTAPGTGARVRVFLHGKEAGWYAPLTPNGIEALDRPPVLYAAGARDEGAAADADPPGMLRFWWLFVAGLGLGLLGGWLATRMGQRSTPRRLVEERGSTVRPA